MLRLEANHVALRPLRAEDLDALCQGSRHLDDRAQPHGPPAARAVRAADRALRPVAEGPAGPGHRGQRPPGGRDPGGQGRAWNLPAGVAQLGIAIFDPADRGRGTGSTAAALLTGWLFEHAAVVRVQAGTAVDNTAMRKVFERLGFACEGVMRGFIAVRSGREDCALYAVTKDAWHGRATER
ncbi:MAG TPA: GNAT family protein [Actinomycetota bacterium]|nr:GNAT family protein [Actinomycetota bacterium]